MGRVLFVVQEKKNTNKKPPTRGGGLPPPPLFLNWEGVVCVEPVKDLFQKFIKKTAVINYQVKDKLDTAVLLVMF